MTIKAIETQYKGYRFRSRLEARWAVFFDVIGWEWEYEPEGFELPDGTRYLPDFRLNRLHWVEVKPYAPTAAELHKARLLCDGAHEDVIFAVGVPDASAIVMLDGFAWAPVMDGEYGEVCEVSFSLSRYCAMKWNYPGVNYDTLDQLMSDDFRACNAARGARFEHGESGAWHK